VSLEIVFVHKGSLAILAFIGHRKMGRLVHLEIRIRHKASHALVTLERPINIAMLSFTMNYEHLAIAQFFATSVTNVLGGMIGVKTGLEVSL
jgi:hypothetical protein